MTGRPLENSYDHMGMRFWQRITFIAQVDAIDCRSSLEENAEGLRRNLRRSVDENHRT